MRVNLSLLGVTCTAVGLQVLMYSAPSLAQTASPAPTDTTAAPEGSASAGASVSVGPAASSPPPVAEPAPLPERDYLHGRYGIGARLMYGVPGGDLAQGSSMSDSASGVAGAEISGDIRWTPQLTTALYLGLGIGSPGGSFAASCNASGVSCSTSDITLGVRGEYRFLPTLPFNPWVGIGGGAEILSRNASDNDGNSASLSATGWYVELSAGLDVTMGDFAIGPFAAAQFGEYVSTSYTINDESSDAADIGQTAMHEWFVFGLRGRFGFGHAAPTGAPPAQAASTEALPSASVNE